MSIVGEVEKKSVNEKISFLKQIPEFESIQISRNKMQTLCNAMLPIVLVKNQIVHKEGDLCKHVFFVKQGDIKIQRKIYLPANYEEAQESVANPELQPGESKKQHVVGLVSVGQVLSVQEASNNSLQY